MTVNKKLFLVLVSICLSYQCFSQEGFSKYYDLHSFSLISITDHLEIQFTWDLEGKAQTFMNEGLNSYREGKLRLAISNFDEVIKLSPRFWPAYYYRGACNKNSLNLKSAVADLRSAIDLNPKLMNGYIELGEIFHVTNNLPQAKEMYDRAVRLNRNMAIAHYYLGTYYLTVRENERALSEYHECNKLDPHFPDAYFVQGVISTQAKNQKEGLDFFNKAIAADSTFESAIFWRGLVYAIQKENDKCLKDWDRLILLAPQNPFYLLMRGFMLIESKRYDDAFRDFKTVLQRGPTEETYSGKLTIFEKQGDMRSVAKYLISTGYGLKTEAFDQLKESFCLWISQKNGDALLAADSSIQIQESTAAFLLKGMIFNQRRDFAMAEENLVQALKGDPDIFEAHEKLSLYYYNRKNWTDTFKELNEMKRLKPGSSVLIRFGGMLKSNSGDYPGCINDLHIYLKEEPGDTDAQQTLGFCYDKVFKGDYTLKSLYVLLDDERSDLLKAFASDLLAGDTTRAVAILDGATGKWPRDNVMNLLAVDRYMEARRFEAADKVLNSVYAEFDNYKKSAGVSPAVGERSEALYLSSRLSAHKKDLNAALKQINEALAIDPFNCLKLFQKMKVLIDLHEYSAAKSELNTLKKAGFQPGIEYFNKHVKN